MYVHKLDTMNFDYVLCDNDLFFSYFFSQLCVSKQHSSSKIKS